MRTVVLGPRPKQLDELIEHRRTTGADLYDEIWEGEYHMAPAPPRAHAILDDELARRLHPFARGAGLVGSGPFNLGRKHDFRVPDRGLHRERSNLAWCPTAALVVEIVSPDDETWEKLPFYAAHDVDEVVIVDPDTGTVTWLGLTSGTYEPLDHSRLLDIDVSDLVCQIDWPPTDTDDE